MTSVWIGFDPREAASFAVTRQSVRDNAPRFWPIHGLILEDLQKTGLYTRPHEYKPGVDRPVMWDVLSDAPMATQHANARFLVPFLAKTGWAIFMDGDMLVRYPLQPLVEKLDRSKAVYCVHHKHQPANGTKMDGQVQTTYGRKNWSSFMIFNCDHPSNNHKKLAELTNTLPGRDLHRLCWLQDDEIGELDPEWNWLVGHSDEKLIPKNVHFTEGTPDMRGYENVPYSEDWRRGLLNWARR